MIVIITEKPSAKKNFIKAFGGEKGTYNGKEYEIVNSLGHILAFPKNIDELVSEENKDRYKVWDLKYLPFNRKEITFKKNILVDSTGKPLRPIYDNIKDKCLQADEIIIATDNDPSGEGTLLASEILITFYNKIKDKKISRMFFEDESEKELRNAFDNRVSIPNLLIDKDYLKSNYRSRFDYLSMEYSRAATKLGDNCSVLRNGRLKSFMITTIGDGLEAVKNYKKIPYYQKAFISDTGVWFINKNDEKKENKEEIDISDLKSSQIIVDEVKQVSQVPPKLLDLASLSGILESKGYRSADILKAYQLMYEDQVVSYPRTEDKYITSEQFSEMLPYIDKIATLIGADASLLTHRQMRPSHIKQGLSHGANRPASNIPTSLEELEKYGRSAIDIYILLSLSFLRMFAEDSISEKTVGHVKDYDNYQGSVTNVVKMGWKDLVIDDVEDNEYDNKELGSIANPDIKESFSKRPPTPTMKWLMKQLEKYNVGTGATRTSTYAEMVNENVRFYQISAKKGKLDLTDYGKMNYILLKDTYIGSYKFTENLQEEMEKIATGEIAPNGIDSLLDNLETFYNSDVEIMKRNALNIPDEIKHPKEFQEKEKYIGIFENKEICFNRNWGSHYFSDKECHDLLAGKTISISLKSKYGEYTVSGRLKKQTYKGNTFYGFSKE